MRSCPDTDIDPNSFSFLQEDNMYSTTKRRRWRWIRHINRMALNAIPRVALRWTPAGKWKRGRPKLTLRRSVEKEMREVGWTWSH